LKGQAARTSRGPHVFKGFALGNARTGQLAFPRDKRRMVDGLLILAGKPFVAGSGYFLYVCNQ